MQAREFNEQLAKQLRMPPVEAEHVGRSFLETIGERLPAREARQFAAQLPKELADAVDQKKTDTEYDYAEFLSRFSQRAGLSRRGAAAAARTIWDALSSAISAGELDKALQVLPENFQQLGQNT